MGQLVPLNPAFKPCPQAYRRDLTDEELRCALRNAELRRENHYLRRTPPNHRNGLTEAGAERGEFVGAIGEGLVASATGMAILPGAARRPDVGPLEVRTIFDPTRCLLIRADEKPEAAYVLTLVLWPETWILGWLFGHEAMLPHWAGRLNDGSPGFYVPQYALRPIDPLLNVATRATEYLLDRLRQHPHLEPKRT